MWLWNQSKTETSICMWDGFHLFFTPDKRFGQSPWAHATPAWSLISLGVLWRLTTGHIIKLLIYAPPAAAVTSSEGVARCSLGFVARLTMQMMTAWRQVMNIACLCGWTHVPLPLIKNVRGKTPSWLPTVAVAKSDLPWVHMTLNPLKNYGLFIVNPQNTVATCILGINASKHGRFCVPMVFPGLPLSHLCIYSSTVSFAMKRHTCTSLRSWPTRRTRAKACRSYATAVLNVSAFIGWTKITWLAAVRFVPEAACSKDKSKTKDSLPKQKPGQGHSTHKTPFWSRYIVCACLYMYKSQIFFACSTSLFFPSNGDQCFWRSRNVTLPKCSWSPRPPQPHISPRETLRMGKPSKQSIGKV